MNYIDTIIEDGWTLIRKWKITDEYEHIEDFPLLDILNIIWSKHSGFGSVCCILDYEVMYIGSYIENLKLTIFDFRVYYRNQLLVCYKIIHDDSDYNITTMYFFQKGSDEIREQEFMFLFKLGS